MSGITVQLVFAFVGTRVPYFMAAPASEAPHTTSAAPKSPASASSSPRGGTSPGNSPNLGPCAAPCLVTAQDLLSRLAKSVSSDVQAPNSPSSGNASASTGSGAAAEAPPAHKPPVFELFDFASLDPLEGGAILHDEQVLLVLCDTQTTSQLVEALQLEWLEVYSGAHYPSRNARRPPSAMAHAHETDMAVCTTEEKLRNVMRAQQTLCRPVTLHLALLTKELSAREATLRAQLQQLAKLRAFSAGKPASATGSGPDSASAFPLLAELEPSLDSSGLARSAADEASVRKMEAPLALCESRIRTVDALVQRAGKHHKRLLELAEAERVSETAFASGEVCRACQEYLDRTEQDRRDAEAIIGDFQVEMTRQLKAVRHLVAYTTQVRGLVSKAKYEMGVVELILSRLSLTGLRPRLMEEAEALLRRRVILRRAARRQMLLLQETEFVELQQDLESFSQRPEVQKALPEKVRWYLRAPLPGLQPEEDPVATLLDHALIDREEDEAQELLEKTQVPFVLDAADPAQNAQQIAESLLPVARLTRRLEQARASAIKYRQRAEELEQRLRLYEAAAALQPQPAPAPLTATALPEALHSVETAPQEGVLVTTPSTEGPTEGSVSAEEN